MTCPSRQYRCGLNSYCSQILSTGNDVYWLCNILLYDILYARISYWDYDAFEYLSGMFCLCFLHSDLCLDFWEAT